MFRRNQNVRPIPKSARYIHRDKRRFKTQVTAPAKVIITQSHSISYDQ